MKYLSFVILALALYGCSTTAHLYPTEGPMADINPKPVLKAKVKGIMGDSGSILLTMQDGEVCEGRWSVIAPKAAGYSSGSGMLTDGTSLLTGTGSATDIGHSERINNGEAYLSCDKGTFIEISFRVGSGTASGNGVAKDNKGNKYKVIF